MSETIRDTERAVPERATLRVSDLRRAAANALRWIRTDWMFVIALAAGAALRAIAQLGFRPMLFFNDGMEYLGVALRFQAYPVRPIGYSALLRLLLPFHSFALVAAVQHLMGLSVALMLYLLLRRWRVARPLATLGVLPQLLDVHQIELEHLLVSDTLFIFLLTTAVTVAAWNRRSTPITAGVVGLLLALAVLTRSVGLPVLVLVGCWLMVQRPGWRPIVVFAVLALAPLGAYATWFHHEHGAYALTQSDGVFLYSRVAVFAECSKIKPPADLQVLCESTPPSQRLPSNYYIWNPIRGPDGRAVVNPLHNLPGGHLSNPVVPEEIFTAARNSAARRFAVAAIEAQPGDYLRVGWHDFMRTFTWSREPYPNREDLAAYKFSLTPTLMQTERVFLPGATAGQDMFSYEPGVSSARTVGPYADEMISYQRFGFVPGPVLGGLLILGLVGGLAYWRRDERSGPITVLSLVALTLLIVPPFTAEFDYRYILPALPLCSVSAALTLAALVPRCSDPPEPVAGDGRPTEQLVPLG